MKILLTGAAGMLAAEIIPELKSKGHDVVCVDINERFEGIINVDIRDKQGIKQLIEKESPDYVFHLAAETNVDLCEKDPDHAFRSNYVGTENIVVACREVGAGLVFISTGAVFYGDQAKPYTEFDIPRARNVYGNTKYQAEKFIQQNLSHYFILRAGWMVGGWAIDKKFVYKIVQQLCDGKRELKVVADKFGSPTFTKDFAAHFMTIVNSGRYGLYHLVNNGTCSRYDIALKIVEFMGLRDKVAVEPINSAQFPLPAPRGDSEMLRNYKLDLLDLNTMPRWESSLKDYIETNKEAFEFVKSGSELVLDKK